MKKGRLSKYLKLATVLILDIPPILVLVMSIRAENSDFAGFAFAFTFFFLIGFNLWAFIIYKLSKLIQKPILRNIFFYLLVLLFFFAPCFFILLLHGLS